MSNIVAILVFISVVSFRGILRGFVGCCGLWEPWSRGSRHEGGDGGDKDREKTGVKMWSGCSRFTEEFVRLKYSS